MFEDFVAVYVKNVAKFAKWSISLLNLPYKLLISSSICQKTVFCIDSRKIVKHLKILEEVCLLMIKSSKIFKCLKIFSLPVQQEPAFGIY